MINEETGASNAKKIGIMAAIVAVISGLLAWSLISLYKTPAYAPEEETFAEEELGEEEEVAAPAPAGEAAPETATEAPATEEKAAAQPAKK